MYSAKSECVHCVRVYMDVGFVVFMYCKQIISVMAIKMNIIRNMVMMMAQTVMIMRSGDARGIITQY